MESQGTFNNSIVHNILRFLTYPHMTYLVKRNQDYRNPKTARKCGFWQWQSMVRISSWTELPEQLVQKWTVAHDPFRCWLNFKWHMLQFSLPFWIESAWSERLSLKLMWTSTNTDLGKAYYTKVVDNFDTFPANINTPLYEKRFRSNDLLKSRVMLEIPIFWAD
jgi:hypothetical protein